MVQMRYFAVKNRRASLLRQRKYRLVRRFGLPADALGGHLAMNYRRCGKPTCRCADGRGHPMWTLSCSFEGKKVVQVLPKRLASELTPLVEQGRELREAVMEVLAINLQLLRLWRSEQRDRPATPKPRKGAGRRKRKSRR
jgi:hypothetical protein